MTRFIINPFTGRLDAENSGGGPGGFVSTITGNDAVPVSAAVGGNINIIGATTAAGTNPVVTSGAGNTVTINVQKSQAIAAADTTKIGLSNFDSSAFSVDATGFVTLNGGGSANTNLDVDAHTAPGTDPVVPLAGKITLTGGQVATGVVGTNVIQTNSLAANTVTIQIQRSTAISSTDITKNGVSHFNSANFSVDANGFVSLTSTGALVWSVITADQVAVAGHGYICNKAGLLTLTLPASGAIGDIIEVTGINTALGWSITQNANQQIFYGTSNTSSGIGGSLSSTKIRDSVKILCVVAGASTIWNVLTSQGNLTVV